MEAVQKSCRNERIIKTCLLLLFLVFVILLAVFTKHAANEDLTSASILLFKQYPNKIVL